MRQLAVCLMLVTIASVATAQTLPPFVDPNVEPAQRLEPPLTVPDRTNPGPTVPTGVATTPAPSRAAAIQPPPAVVQIQVHTPSHVAHGKPVPNKIIVVNNSNTTARNVVVRVPFPANVATLSKSEPPADNAAEFAKAIGKPTDLLWKFASLGKGEQKTIELEFKPVDGSKELRARAFVSFEHGIEVVTVLDKAKLTVTKTATQQVSLGNLATVRVEVTNSGTVPITEVRLVENVSIGAEFRGDKDAEKGDVTKGEAANQRVWQLGDLLAGQSKIVTYQLYSKAGGDLKSTSFAASKDAQSDPVEKVIKILVPALKVELTGPTAVEANQPGTYTATVFNTGTQPLTNVQLLLSIPSDCDVTKMTNGGRNGRDGVVWTLPVLPAGESRQYRVGASAQTSGRKIIKATVTDARANLDDTKTVTTTFAGRADLTWIPTIDPVVIASGKQGTVTIKVSNQGGETEKALRVRVELPDRVKLVQTKPSQYEMPGNEIIFKAVKLAPGATETFTVTFEAKQPGRAFFRLRLEADSLGERPLLKEAAIEINNSR